MVIRGDVQGVGFRWFLANSARPLGLLGWVRNRRDGSVELTAEGERGALDKLLEAAWQGPRGARVSGLEVEWEEAAGGLEPFGFIY